MGGQRENLSIIGGKYSMRLFRILILLILVASIFIICFKEDLLAKVHKNTDQLKPALLRLEDVGPGGPYKSEENLKKLMVIADYLHQEGIPFHISLIPRMVEPSKSYDVKITDNSHYAKEFLTTIQSAEKLGGIVGIHGYTHQYGNTNSAEGFEFYNNCKSPDVPKTYQYAQNRIDKAIELFEEAKITPAYWETPHYTVSSKQHSAFEEQIGLFYENNPKSFGMNFTYNSIDYYHSKNDDFVTVPTPLGYIGPNENVDSMIKRLDLESHFNILSSLFYHPFKEFDYIHKKYNNKGEAYYIYDTNSPLHKIIKAFKDRGYTFVSIYSLARFVPAQHIANLTFKEGDTALVGRFGPGCREKILVWNKGTGQWHMYEYTPSWYCPKKVKAFSDQTVLIEDQSLTNNSIPLVGDFNGDNQDDLIIFDPSRMTFSLTLNKGDKFVSFGKAVLTLSGLKFIHPLVGDYNNDGLDDLTIYDQENGRLGLALNNGNGFNEIHWQYVKSLDKANKKLLVGDFNGDGKDEIVMLDSYRGEWWVLSANPMGYFSVSKSWMKKQELKEDWIPFAADINGDNKCDLVFYKAGYWKMFISDGAKFIYCGDYGLWGKSLTGVPLLADLNGDDKSDLVMIDNNEDNGYALDTAISVLGR